MKVANYSAIIDELIEELFPEPETADELLVNAVVTKCIQIVKSHSVSLDQIKESMR